MKKLLTLIFLLKTLLLFGQSGNNPNVVLIYIDDLDFHELGYFNSKILTPNIDSFIEEGVQFNNAYVTSAVCTPSRFSLLTGKFASNSPTLRDKYDDEQLPNIGWNTHLGGHANIANLLQENDVYTGVVGKWHLGAHSTNSYEKDQDPSDPEILQKLQEDYESVQLSVKSNGFDYADALYKGNPIQQGPAALHFHNVEWITSKSLDFLDKSAESNKPFFLYYSTTVPHGPSPNESLRNEDYITPLGILDASQILPSGMLSRQEILDLVENSDKEKPYMTWLDEGMGALFRKLKEIDQYDNTMIIIMSDHQSRGKYTNYEGARVPLVIKPANWKSGSTERSQLVANIDMVPTILSAMGITHENQDLDGEDLMPLFESSFHQEVRSNLLLEIGYSKALKNTQGYKIIVNKFPSTLVASAIENQSQLTHDGLFYPDTEVRYNADDHFPHYFDHLQLYNLNTDPKEQVNLIDNQDHSLNAHNLYSQLKIELSKLPHSYTEYMKSNHLLNARISEHQSNLKIQEIVDSVSFSPVDTLLFESPDVICDTLSLEFTILDPSLNSLNVEDIYSPHWLETVSTKRSQNKFSLVLANNKKYAQDQDSLKITFDNGTITLTYKAYLHKLPTLTVAVNDTSKIYGDPNPNFILSYDGFVNKDGLSALTEIPTTSTLANKNSDVGSYQIQVSGGNSDDYHLTYVNGTMNVKTAQLLAKATDKNKIYGDANPHFDISFEGFKNDDGLNSLDQVPTIATTADITSDVGSYPITIDGGSAKNYDLKYENGIINVLPRTLSVTADNKQIIIGDEIPDLTISYHGFVNEDDESVINELPTSNVSLENTLSPGDYSITLNGGFDDNYDLQLIDGILSIVPEVLSIQQRSSDFVFPNPVSDMLGVNMDEPFQVTVFNLSGKAVPVQRVFNKVDVRTIGRGTYVIQIEDMNNNIRYKGLFIKR